MFKVVITGPECSGKSTLARGLAAYYESSFLSEYSREYLDSLDRPYTKNDLLIIARKQFQLEVKYSDQNMLLCDTSMLVLKVWSRVKYGSVHPEILELLEGSRPDLYILPDYNIPYEEDPLREHPDDRHHLNQIYLEELSTSLVPWIGVYGDPKSRIEEARIHIDTLMVSKS